MASASVTVTAATKTGLTATAEQFTGVQRVEYDFNKEMLYLTDSVGRRLEFPYDAITTVTHTIANKISSITLS